MDPSAVAAAIFGKTLQAVDEAKADLDARGIDLYDEHFDAVRQLVEKTADDAESPDEVAEAIGDALMSRHPKTHYLAGH